MPDLIRHLCRLHEGMPYLPELINSLTILEQSILYIHIALIPEEKEDFIGYVLNRFHYARLAEIIIQYEPHCSLRANNALASIALHEKNSIIHDYLVKNDFDFPRFLMLFEDSKDGYVNALLSLEEQFYPLSDIAKLKRIQDYIDRLCTKNELKLPFDGVPAPFVDQETKKRLITLHTREALRIIYDHADKISKFRFSFNQCRTISEVERRYRALLFAVDIMVRDPELVEASQSLRSVDKNNGDLSIVGATAKIKAEIKKAKLAEENTIGFTSKGPPRSMTPFRTHSFFQPIRPTEPARTGPALSFRT